MKGELATLRFFMTIVLAVVSVLLVVVLWRTHNLGSVCDSAGRYDRTRTRTTKNITYNETQQDLTSKLKGKISSIFRFNNRVHDHGPGRVRSDRQTSKDSIQGDPPGWGFFSVVFDLVVPMSALFFLGSLKIWINFHGIPKSKSSKYTVPARLCT